jgi:hypothetical protein
VGNWIVTDPATFTCTSEIPGWIFVVPAVVTKIADVEGAAPCVHPIDGP